MSAHIVSPTQNHKPVKTYPLHDDVRFLVRTMDRLLALRQNCLEADRSIQSRLMIAERFCEAAEKAYSLVVATQPN